MTVASGQGSSRGWGALPHDILRELVHQLHNGKDVVSLMLVNHHWRTVAVQHQLWDTHPVTLSHSSHALPTYARKVHLTYAAIPSLVEGLTRWNETRTDPFPVHSVKSLGGSWQQYAFEAYDTLVHMPVPNAHDGSLIEVLHTLPCLKHLDLSAVVEPASNGASVPRRARPWLQSTHLLQLDAFHCLESLDLAGQDRLIDRDLFHLIGLSNLKHLNISHCKGLTHAVIPIIASISSLRELVAHGCDSIASQDMDRYCLLTQLHLLHISCGMNNLNSRAMTAIADLTSLTDLSVGCWYTSPVGAALATLSSLPNLTKLCLNTNVCRTEAHEDNVAVAEAVANLKQLKVLQLGSVGSQTGVLSIALSTLTNLEVLQVANVLVGCLQGIPTDALSRVTSLTINSGTCCVEDFAHLQGLSMLKVLNASYIQGLIRGEGRDSALPYLQHLETLTLRSCPVGPVFLESMCRLTSLTCVHMSYLGDIPVERVRHLSELRWLQHLDLQGSRLALEGVVHLCALAHLQHLNLACCQIGTCDRQATDDTQDSGACTMTAPDMSCLSKLSGLSNLTWLNLTYNDLGPAAVPHLAQLPAVRTLLMKHNRLGAHSNTLNELSSLTSLVEADLQWNSISHAAAEGLRALTGLERLKVSGDELTADGVLQLRQLPRLKVLWVHFSGDVPERVVDKLVVNWRPQYQFADCGRQSGQHQYCVWCDKSYDELCQRSYDKVLCYCTAAEVAGASRKGREHAVSAAQADRTTARQSTQPHSVKCAQCRQM